MKSRRQAKILELVESQPIERQEVLLDLLRESGFDVTQATVSRDIRELNIVKATTGDGKYRYVATYNGERAVHGPSRFETIFKESVLKVDYSMNIVLVKCFDGMANAACELFDSMVWDHVVGTLAGDDTFIILVRDEAAAVRLCEQLRKYAQ
ncbi:MAG: arginine repressor [Oscillospiraceae bacterium]